VRSRIPGTMLVHRAGCLFMPQLSVTLTASNYGRMARMSWPW